MYSQPTELSVNNSFAKVKAQVLRPFVFALFITLSLYYVWVLYLAVHPNVSTAYQTYYIDKKTRYWGQENIDLIWPEMGTINVAEPSPFLSRQGWESLPQREGRELVHDASLYFNFEKTPHSPVRIKISLNQSITEPVYISANQGRKVMLMPLELNSLETTLPASVFLRAQPIQQLRFETDASLNVRQVTITEAVQ
jgi:hypothetical protein